MGFTNDELFLQGFPLGVFTVCLKNKIPWDLEGCSPEKLGQNDYALNIPTGDGSHRVRFTLRGDDIGYWCIRSEPVSLDGLPDKLRLSLYDMFFKDISSQESIFAFCMLDGNYDALASSIYAQNNTLCDAETFDVEKYLQVAMAVGQRGDGLKRAMNRVRKDVLGED